jgi:SacI restriction endonuclease
MATKLKKEAKTLPLLHQTAKALLNAEWLKVLALDDLDKARDSLWGTELEELIVNGGSTYPYVLLGQILAKASKASVNALSLQDSSSLEGAIDVRMLVKNVVVSWNKEVGKPFPGTNLDPYVNNPARYKNFGEEMESKAGNREQYGRLFKVVQHVQEKGHQEAKRLLRLILIEARRSLENNKRDYVGPARASLDDVMKVLAQFLAERSNGVRLQVVTYAVFKAFAEAFSEFGEVRSYSTNSSDASGDRAGDVERVRLGKVDYAIEVKDRTLTSSDLESSILKARQAQIDNLLFVVQANPLMDSSEAALQRMAHEFTRGIDVNVAEAMPFFASVLILFEPSRRAALLRSVHDALHELGANYKHVQEWLKLMKAL